MRNISIASRVVRSLPSGDLGDVSTSTIDLDDGTVFVASEISERQGEITVKIWRFAAESPAPQLFVEFRSPARSTAGSSQIVSFHVHAELRYLCVILSGGDIATIPLDNDAPEADIVGSVDSGIEAASWSPDDAFLILVNGAGDMIQMNRDFEVLYEASLRTSEFGQDKPDALGWGSKSTQFHGSIGKSAAEATAPPLVGSSPDDDGRFRISWRGDVAFFSVSALELDPSSDFPGSASSSPTLKRRVIRVYSPTPTVVLHSTVESTPGLEHSLAWNPSGSLIASTQRFGSSGGLGSGREGRHDVVFYERNGLRRSSFEIVKGGSSTPLAAGETPKYGYRVKELAWSCDSSVLAVWIHTDDHGDIVQLWTIGNYHWYLKQSLAAPSEGHFTSISWHPEQALRLDISTSRHLLLYTFSWETCISRISPPNDSGSVAVVDGENILITPFRIQNVPPPMSSFQIPVVPSHHDSPTGSGSLPFPSAPLHLAYSVNEESDMLSILHGGGVIEIWDITTNLAPPLRSNHGKDYKVTEPVRLWKGTFSTTFGLAPRQVILWKKPQGSSGKNQDEWAVAVLASTSVSTESGASEDAIYVTYSQETSSTIRLPFSPGTGGTGRLIVASGKLWFQFELGELHEVDLEAGIVQPLELAFPEFCFNFDSVKVPSEPTATVFVGLSATGNLHTTTRSTPISEHATSFALTPTYLVYISSTHEAHFVPIDSLSPNSLTAPSPSTEKRRVERGSRIVVAVPSAMTLVLQMPRGNLETISPRPFVLEVIRADVTRQSYRKAFLACRKHRVDLNVIIDHDPEAFMTGLEVFVEQVHEVDHINLFLAGVGRSSQTPERIAHICDAIRTHLEKKDITRYVNSILTAHVVKTPPALEAALSLLAQLKESNPELVEDAVKYIIFLVDANTLFDAALGMYDFPLTLLIAQHSQRDPKEYLPFLRELRALPQAYQRFTIDNHLKRYSKALIGLRDAGDNHLDEAIHFIELHKLYKEALSVWKDNYASHVRLLEVYGDYLYERREFPQAALAFTLSKTWRKAILAHEKAHAWREAFSLASNAELNEQEIKNMAQRIIEELAGRKRFLEAARLALDYAEDVPSAVLLLVQGNDISEALRITSLYPRKDLVNSHIYPGALELREEIGEEIQDTNEQLAKQFSRWEELQVKKLQEPDSFYMNEELLHDVDMMTDAGDSVVSTAFTRYTAAPSATSKGSKHSSRSKKKTERKRGKKGTVDEEEYIVASIVKLVSRLEQLRSECGKILPHLLAMSEKHQEEGEALYAELQRFETSLLSAVAKIWPEADEDKAQPNIERPKKPVIGANPDNWLMAFLESR